MTKYDYMTATVQGEIGQALTMASNDGWETVCYLGTQPADPENPDSKGGMVFLLRKEQSAIIVPTESETKRILTLEK